MDRKPSVRRRRYRKRWTEKCKDYFRSFLAFMFSNVGIIGLVVGYTVAGASIFIEIEGKNKLNMTYVPLLRADRAANIWKISNTTNILDEVTWKKNITEELLQFQHALTRAYKNGTYYSEKFDQAGVWSFPSAFLFSLTVITTIGYGNVVPKTKLGKVTTIVYAIIGMPLFLLYLSNIGDIMARSFKWLYAKLCLCRCCPGVTRKRTERRRRRTAELSVEYFGNQDGSESPEASIRRGSIQGRPKVTYGNTYDADDDESSDDQTEMTEISDSQAVTVPVTICLAIMVGYIFGGALLFSGYDHTWSTLDGSYFCFISLTTIGFGDYVPGKAVYADHFEVNTIFGSIYLMLGMALIAMCFNLMQEEVIHKITGTIRTIKYIFRCNR